MSTPELTTRELQLIEVALRKFAEAREAEAAKIAARKRPNIIDVDMNNLMAREVRALMAKLAVL